MTQSITKTQQPAKVTFGARINAPAVKNQIYETLGSEMKGRKFVASITSAVATNAQLAQCEFNSLLQGALQGEVLGLSQQLGEYSLVPYNCKVRLPNGSTEWVKKAQFQIGYKGIIQLAERSGEYKRMNVKPVKEGELVKCDPIKDIYEFEPIQNIEERLKAKTIGYYAYFTYHNGYTQESYWSIEEVVAHAKRFSKTYSEDTGVWHDSFEKMARKTVIKDLLSTWGIKSIEMQQAIKNDQAVITTDEQGQQKIEYVDNDSGELYDANTGVVEETESNDQPVIEQDTINFDEL